MPISIRNGLITIETAGTTYQMKADSLSTLIHTYYGPKIDGADMSPLIVPRDRGFSGNPLLFARRYAILHAETARSPQNKRIRRV